MLSSFITLTYVDLVRYLCVREGSSHMVSLMFVAGQNIIWEVLNSHFRLLSAMNTTQGSGEVRSWY